MPCWQALHDADSAVRASAAASLGQVGVGNEAVVSALLAGPARCRLGCAEAVRQRAWARWEWATRRW